MKKMKKLNSKGFILAETLVVSVFLMVLFTMIYTNFYPLIGEYEKRENYDDADGKYTAYWIKRIIESDAYILSTNPSDYTESPEESVLSARRRIHSMNEYGYMRFECSDVSTSNSQRELCASLVNSFEISGCDNSGNNCDIFITNYQIGSVGNQELTPNFKRTVRDPRSYKYKESCTYTSTGETQPDRDCKVSYFQTCCVRSGLEASMCPDPDAEGDALFAGVPEDKRETATNNIITRCANKTKTRTFTSGMRDYILSLPNYRYSHSSTGAKYRVIIVRHHTKDKNNFYSYATMEVIKNEKD